MKTIDIEEVKNGLAKEYFGSSWNYLFDYEKAFLTDHVANEYAKQCCDEQINACVKFSAEHPYDYIKNTPNVLKV